MFVAEQVLDRRSAVKHYRTFTVYDVFVNFYGSYCVICYAESATEFPSYAALEPIICRSLTLEKRKRQKRVTRPEIPRLPSSSINCRLKRLSYRTEQAYVSWAKRFILFHNKRHPKEMGEQEIEAFLTHLARNRGVAASTQNQALNAIVFMYRAVVKQDLGQFGAYHKAKESRRLPTVLTTDEVQRMLAHLDGTYGLMARLLYGTGMRLMECIRLRVKDVDFVRGSIIIRSGKGDKDRVTILPESLRHVLNSHIERLRQLHIEDRKANIPGVELPDAYARKSQNAGISWAWQWVFPAKNLSQDPRSGRGTPKSSSM
ncbi:MAG: integron integrase [Schlesneria sp.]|nr:integron integrase [Schlesneria sp.]